MAKISMAEKVRLELANSDQKVRGYFPLLSELVENISSPEPALAYCFQRIEMAQRVSIYVLLMREYRTDSELAWKVVDKIDMTRSGFPEMYKEISGYTLPSQLRNQIKPAEEIRDDITHGRGKTAAQINSAICCCLQYANAMNAEFSHKVGFSPFGDLRGVTSNKSRPQLDKKLTRVVLKGLGFDLS